MEFDFNEVRAKLGLPLRQDLDPAVLESRRVTLPRVHLVPAEKLSDEHLASVYMLAMLYRAIARSAADGDRDSPAAQFEDRTEYRPRSAIRCTPSPATATTPWSGSSGRKKRRSRRSSRPPDTCCRNSNCAACAASPRSAGKSYMRLQTQHGREPGVAEALYAWLGQIGAITPDGRPAIAAGLAGQPAAVPAGAASRAGTAGLWTPGQPAQPAAGQPKPSIWVPGMD